MKRWLQTFSFLSLLFVSSPCPLPPCWFTPPLPIVLFCFERCRSRSLAAGPTPAAHTHCFDQRSSRKRTKRASSLPQGASLSMSLALPSHRCASLPVCNGGGWPWSRMHTHAHAPSLLHTFCLTQPPPPPQTLVLARFAWYACTDVLQISLDDFTYLTRIHYLAPSDGMWGEHEGVSVSLSVSVSVSVCLSPSSQ